MIYYKHCFFTFILIFCLNTQINIAQSVSPEKGFVLDWLNQPEVLKKYGKISDAIWSYAELGLQEYKSSSLLADNLEKAGFKVERGLAGMPTCFVASYGSGKPVIGLGSRVRPNSSVQTFSQPFSLR